MMENTKVVEFGCKELQNLAKRANDLADLDGSVPIPLDWYQVLHDLAYFATVLDAFIARTEVK